VFDSIDDAKPEDGTSPNVGDLMPDGTIYAGTSPDTGDAMYTTPADAPGAYNQDSGSRYCADLQANGHHDWRVPTKDELNVLYQNRAAIGGFNKTGSIPVGWYWSSSQNPGTGSWDQRFSDGGQYINDDKDNDSSVRCVR
jgi:hypothetical protein